MTKKILPIITLFLALFIMCGCFDTTKDPSTFYTVTFDANGGTSVESSDVEEGKTVSKPSDPTYEGYVFVCWIYNGEEFDFTTPINSDITLVASWEEEVIEPTYYTVTFDANGGTSVESSEVEEGKTVSKPSDPTYEGYVFVCWTYNGEEFDFTTAITSDITLVASWKEKIVVGEDPDNGNYGDIIWG